MKNPITTEKELTDYLLSLPEADREDLALFLDLYPKDGTEEEKNSIRKGIEELLLQKPPAFRRLVERRSD